MKLNENTVNVLRNFSSIQPNLVVVKGNVIKTMAEAKNILATAELDQSFDKDFGIYDLNEFLNVITLVKNPDLQFGKDSVEVNGESGLSAVHYNYADTNILTAPKSNVTAPEFELSFKLSEDNLNNIRRASSVLAHDKMTITPNGGSVRITVTDKDNATSNSYHIDVPVIGNQPEEDYCFIMNIDNLKLISGEYEVNLSSRLLSQFVNKNAKVSYFIALEKSSTFGG